MKDKKDKKQKEHADFQDDYKRSSNFPTLKETEAEKLKIKGDGDLKVKKSNKKDS